jgi:hypothetical protein
MSRRSSSDPRGGWPSSQHSSITPQGEFEQADKFLSGLSRQQGWRKSVARAGAVIVLILILGGIAVGIAHLFG